MFNTLSSEHIRAIVEIQLGHLRERLAARGLTLEVTDAAKERLAAEGFDPAYGARPLKRVIQKRLQDPLAIKVLQGEFREGDRVVVDVDVTGEFTFTAVVEAEVVDA